MQGTGGKLIPTVLFSLLGQTGFGPEACIWARRILAQPGGLGQVRPRPSIFLGRDRPGHFIGPRSAHSFFLGRDRPSHFSWADPGPMTPGAEPDPVSWAGPAPLIINI